MFVSEQYGVKGKFENVKSGSAHFEIWFFNITAA